MKVKLWHVAVGMGLLLIVGRSLLCVPTEPAADQGLSPCDQAYIAIEAQLMNAQIVKDARFDSVAVARLLLDAKEERELQGILLQAYEDLRVDDNNAALQTQVLIPVIRTNWRDCSKSKR